MTDITELPKPGVYTDIPIEDYHAGPGVSSSHLKKIWNDSPLAYRWEFIDEKPARDVGKWSEATPRPIAIGGAVAAMMDGEDVFNRGYAVLADCVAKESKNSNAFKRGWAEAVRSFPGKTVILPSERDQAASIVEAIYHHPDPWTRDQLNSLLANPELRAECSFYHRDDETGVLLKSRPDLSIRGGLAADVKSTADCGPWAFSKRINDQGHHIQAGLGLDVMNHAERTAVEQWLLIVVEQKEPYDVAVYYLGKPTLRRGYEIYRAALTRLIGCQRANQWPGKSAGIREINIPAYALNQEIEPETLEPTGVIR